MPTAAAMLMIATVLGATEPALEVLEGDQSSEATADAADMPIDETTTDVDTTEAASTGSGDPLYDRLFAQQDDPGEPDAAESEGLPRLPPWLWILGLAGLGGLYYARKRQRGATPDQGQVEVLGHTRMGTRARLTVIRVVGEDGRMRRLLVSTGEGTPSLVADLGSESDSPQAELASLGSAPDTASTPSPGHTGVSAFAAVLDEAVSLDADIIDDDHALSEGVGLGRVPPPKVPVWNEPPDDVVTEAPRPAAPVSRAAPRAAAPPAAAEETKPPPTAAPSFLEQLDSMLGDEDAPELVMDVAWDSETGWHGLPELPEPCTTTAPSVTPQPGRVIPTVAASSQDEWNIDAHMDDEADEADESWGPLQHQQATAADPLARAGVRPSSRAAFEALLSGGGRQAPEPTRGKRIRPVVHTVKPLRPSQQPPLRRTPYDAMILDDEPAVEAAPTPAPRGRTPQEVHDLVAEVLNERDDTEATPTASPKGNGVVELARYLRRQVAP